MVTFFGKPWSGVVQWVRRRILSQRADQGEWVDHVLTAACNAAAPKIKGRASKKSMYWWNNQIAELRARAIRAKRTFCRARGPNVPEDVKLERRLVYKRARKTLNREIAAAKDNAWEELLTSIEEDP